MIPADPEFMARALRLAERGLFTTHPNPRVGCVLVRDGEIVGEGWHQRAGEPHAERLALAEAGDRALGATAYVTLEPCCHHGRTPPCSDALIAAGVRRVVCAMQDPNPLVAGQGMVQLQAAGMEVLSGVCEAKARALNAGFVKRMETGRPMLRCKLAMSLDGRTAMASGESEWITSSEARQDVHRWRARSDAILTGIGTVLADDPSLDVRLESLMQQDQPLPSPLRVVLDSRLRMPPDARMLRLPGDTLIVCGEDASDEDARELESLDAQLLRLPLEQGQIPLVRLLEELGRRSINEIWTETGPTLAGALLKAGLIDELVLYIAPHLMGSAARGLFHLPGLERMDQRLGLDILDLRSVGRDLRLVARPSAATG